MAKFCTNCGQELIEGAKTCGNCGASVEDKNVTVKATPESGNTTTVNVNTAQGQTNGMAIAGFVVSLVSTILCCGAFNIVSLVLSIVGLTQAKNYNGNGKGLAIAGIVISCIFIFLFIILFAIGFVGGITESINEMAMIIR